MMKTVVSVICCVGIILTGGGCAITHMTTSGFLDDYSCFEESDILDGVRLWYPDGEKAAHALMQDYQAYIIDPVIVYWDDETDVPVIKKETLDNLKKYFTDAIVAAFEEDYPIATEAGEGVLRLRIAVTDIVPNNPVLNVHWATKITRAGMGGAAMEAEFVDAVTGKRVCALIDARQGRFMQYHKGFSKWGYTKDVFVQWAKIFRELVDELHSDTREQ